MNLTVRIMGVLNTTPDSFSDGGLYYRKNAAIKHALTMINEGVDIIDIGGESSRPQATAVNLDEELKRTIPVIKELRKHSNIAISIDTTKPEVMQSALDIGATMVNDISALNNPKSLDLMTRQSCDICLTHMQGNPQTMQKHPTYNNVVNDIGDFFSQKIYKYKQAGIDEKRLILDVGFGFGKTLAHNLSLLNNLSYFKKFGLPLLVGMSKKSMINSMLGGNTKPEERIIGSIVAQLRAVENGATIIRTHNVKQTKDGLKVWYYNTISQ